MIFEFWWICNDQIHTTTITEFRTKMAEHCRGTPIILWGFHVMESHLAQNKRQQRCPKLHAKLLWYFYKLGIISVRKSMHNTVFLIEKWFRFRFPFISFLNSILIIKISFKVYFRFHYYYYYYYFLCAYGVYLDDRGIKFYGKSK